MNPAGWLARDAAWAGDATLDGPVHIAGAFRGALRSSDWVEVAESGRVDGPIEAPQVLVAGTVDGDIIAAERVRFEATARFRGTVTTAWLDVEPGARMAGTFTVARPD